LRKESIAVSSIAKAWSGVQKECSAGAKTSGDGSAAETLASTLLLYDSNLI